jgi:hypothetical protein
MGKGTDLPRPGYGSARRRYNPTTGEYNEVKT